MAKKSLLIISLLVILIAPAAYFANHLFSATSVNAAQANTETLKPIPWFPSDNVEITSSACNNKLCVLTGSRRPSDNPSLTNFAFLSQVSDKGAKWSALPSSTLPPGAGFMYHGSCNAPVCIAQELKVASCSDNACIAGGGETAAVMSANTPDFPHFLLSKTNDNGAHWELTSFPQYTGNFKYVSCGTHICIAAGLIQQPNGVPTLPPQTLLVQSTLNGNWEIVPSVPEGLPMAAHCEGEVCMLVVAASVDNGKSFLMQSIRGGTWQKLAIPDNQNVTSISCTLNGDNCIAGGSTYDTGRPSIISRTKRDGKWDVFSLPSSTAGGIVSATHCNENLCIAAGALYFTNNAAVQSLLAQRVGNGDWTTLPTTPGWFLDADCTQKACIVVGTHNSGPYIMQTKDNGAHWEHAPITGLPTNVAETVLQTIQCSTDYCIATGTLKRGNLKTGPITVAPLYIQSTDSGAHWNVIPLSN
jgi:hypothetical protein